MASFLSGRRVLSLTTGIAGPSAARLLANYGAEVIKVESRLGGTDTHRQFGSGLDASPRFLESNLNVLSLTLNLKNPIGLGLFHELVAVSDVVLDNFRPSVLPRLGLGYDELKAIKPDIIVLCMPGMGASGPKADYGTWGPALAAFSGLTYLWNHPGQEAPVGSQGVYADFLAGLVGPLTVAAALLRRKRTGEGCFLELSQVEAVSYMLGTSFLELLTNGHEPTPIGNDWPAAAPHNTFPCSGVDEWCVVVAEDAEQWQSLCKVIGVPDLAEDPDLRSLAGRRRRLPEIDTAVANWTRQRSAREATRILQEAGVPAGAVQSGHDLFNDSHLNERGFIPRVAHRILGEVPLAGLPARFSNGAAEPYVAAPALGQHNERIICDLLGYSSAQLDEWTQQQVVY